MLTFFVQGFYCQMLVGGAAMSISLPFDQCVVPEGIDGPVGIFITADQQPLNGDAVDRADQPVVAGPTMAFIDTQQQVLSQLVLAASSNSSNSNSTSTTTISPAEASSIIASASAASAAASTGTAGVSDGSNAASASVTDSASSAAATDASSTASASAAAASSTVTESDSTIVASPGTRNLQTGTMGAITIDGWVDSTNSTTSAAASTTSS